MTNKLISLVIITFILSIGHSYADQPFIFPKEKPSIFKKIEKDSGKIFSSNLPQKKPLISQNEDQKKDPVVEQKKELAIKEKEEVAQKNPQKSKPTILSTLLSIFLALF